MSFIAACVTVASLLGAAPESSQRTRTLEAFTEAVKDPFDDAAFQAFLETLPRYGDSYVYEGDLLCSERQVRGYLIALSQQSRSINLGSELLVSVQGGQLDYWKDRSKRKLTYAVDRASFGDDEDKYKQVVKEFASASKEWSLACGKNCGLQFVHQRELDGKPSHEQVTFIVRRVSAGGAFIAAAFFPSDAVERRYVNINDSYFTTRVDRVGVLRHEVGHILGYRHEHIRGVPGCYRDDTLWEPLTEYDPKSVMHYFCGGKGTLTLRLTNLDKQGHLKLYGAP